VKYQQLLHDNMFQSSAQKKMVINKYKNLIQKETADYSSEVKKLTILSNEYKVQVQKTADIEKERVRLQDILSKPLY
jgi:hypothetical protein